MEVQVWMKHLLIKSITSMGIVGTIFLFMAFVVSKNLKVGIPIVQLNHASMNSSFIFEVRFVEGMDTFQIQQSTIIW